MPSLPGVLCWSKSDTGVQECWILKWYCYSVVSEEGERSLSNGGGMKSLLVSTELKELKRLAFTDVTCYWRRMTVVSLTINYLWTKTFHAGCPLNIGVGTGEAGGPWLLKIKWAPIMNIKNSFNISSVHYAHASLSPFLLQPQLQNCSYADDEQHVIYTN